jgi:NAD(P)-dependent dehydrogenase (short-subunit alcohol dehydrogenase family)
MDLGLCARTLPVAPRRSRAVAAALDVTDAAAMDTFAAAVVERFGRIDLWVNNAGILEPIGPLAEADPALLRRNVEVNVLGVLHGSATFARHVRSRPGGGVLVNVSSGAATKPYVGWAAYCASKAALDMATAVVALEERHAGLRAYALSPGLVDTDMQELIRATPRERFPGVERFHRAHREGELNSAGWVARYILRELMHPNLVPADADGRSDAVRRRVPGEPDVGRGAGGGPPSASR